MTVLKEFRQKVKCFDCCIANSHPLRIIGHSQTAAMTPSTPLPKLYFFLKNSGLLIIIKQQCSSPRTLRPKFLTTIPRWFQRWTSNIVGPKVFVKFVRNSRCF